MSFYNTTRWESKRQKVLRRDQYLRQECKRYGKRIPANTVHHMHNRETDELTPLGEQWREKAIPHLRNF